MIKLHISILGIVYYPIGKHAPSMKSCQRISTSEDIVAVENMLGELEQKGLEVGSIVNELDLCKLSRMDIIGIIEGFHLRELTIATAAGLGYPIEQ